MSISIIDMHIAIIRIVAVENIFFPPFFISYGEYSTFIFVCQQFFNIFFKSLTRL